MRELRAAKGGALRVLFSFDPPRQAIALLGGDKSGERTDWYARAVPLADDLHFVMARRSARPCSPAGST